MSEIINISVVIPNYNRSHELLRAIKSCLIQTFTVFEILVCDDGSTDNSRQLVNELNHPKVKWLDCGKNGGPAIPRNIGIKESKGNYIAFLDSDDEWLPSKLEQQIEVMQKTGLKIVCTNAYRILNGENKGAYLSFNKSTITLSDLMQQNTFICSTVLAEKFILLNTSLFPIDANLIAFEDYALWLRLSSQTNIAFVNQCLVNYKDDAQASIRNKWNYDSWDVFQVVFTDFKKWIQLKNIHLKPEQKHELNRLFARIKRKGAPSDWEKIKLNVKKIIGRK